MERRQTVRVKRSLMASVTYLLAIIVVALGSWLGIWATDVLMTYTVLAVGASTLFYCLIRSGLNQRLTDPSLTAAQIITAVGTLLYIAYNAGPARGIVMLWVLMIFIFGVFRLRSQHIWPLAAMTWVAYAAVVVVVFRNHPETIHAGLEIFQGLVVGVVLAWFAVMGSYVSNERLRLRRNEVFYRSMWETVHDAIIISGSSGLIEYANPAVRTIFGFVPEQLVGTPVMKLLAERSPAKHGDEFRQYIEGGQTTRNWNAVELTFTRSDGGAFPAEVSVNEMQVERRRACLLFIRNITARKQTEQALVAARISAEAASQAKTQFLANMTHEMRTPLNGIIGMAEILRQEPLPETARAYVEKVHRSGRALLGVINDVLDFSKIEEGRLVLQRVVFDLPRVIQDVHDLYVESSRTKNIALTLNVPHTLSPLVFGDPSRLRQILSNLVDNAVKFTDSGHIELRAMHEGPDSMRFEVRDTGIGIPLDKQKLIFEAFAQVDGSATRRFGGTGLGLTITRRIVALMGGEIGLSSEPGKGSQFWFSVPLPRSTQHRIVATAAATPASGQPFTGKRILLVEDDESNAEIAVALLDQFGPSVVRAANGALAVAAYRESRYDMVFMDCQMPVMDGLEATRQIRAIEQQRNDGAHTPIAALTAHAFVGYREECIAAGMDDYMTKPVSTEEFGVMLTRWIGETAPQQKSA